MRRLTILPALLACQFWGAVILSAQQQGVPVPTVRTVLSIVCWDKELNLTYLGYEGERPIIAPSKMRSLRTVYNGPRTFQLCEATQGEAAALAGEPLAEVELLQGCAQQLVILFPNDEGGGLPYRALVVDDSLKSFPKQSLRVLNFTGEKVAGKLMEKTFAVSAYGEDVIKLRGLTPPKYLAPFKLVRYVDKLKSWRPVRSTVLRFPPGMRTLVVLLANPSRPQQVKIVMVYDEQSGRMIQPQH